MIVRFAAIEQVGHRSQLEVVTAAMSQAVESA